jgi:hypothetical protein
MRARKYRRLARCVSVGVVVSCTVLAVTASAALASGDYTAGVSPGSVAPGASTTFTLRLTNTSQANPLGAAIVQAPPGFAVTAVGKPSVSGNASISNGQVVLKGLSLRAGQTATVAITATTPQRCEQVPWSMQAFKSSLQGTQLALDGTGSSLATIVSCDSIITEPCPAGGACVPATVTTPTSSFTVTAGPGPSDGTLTASVDPGNPLICSGYEGIDSHWYGFFESTFQRDKTLTLTELNTSSSTDGVALCFGAPYQFETLGDHPAPAGTLPDGSTGFVGLLEICDNDTEPVPDPCVQSITTLSDERVDSGFDTVITATIPAGLTGDPFAHP